MRTQSVETVFTNRSLARTRCAMPFANMECVLRSARAFMIALILVVIVGITLAVTLAAGRRGMCGDGNHRPPCMMFAAALNVYAMIGVSAVTTLATLVTYVVRRRPPALLQRASILTIAAVGAFVLPVLAAGNKLAGALVLILISPLTVTLFAGASLCVLLWFGAVTGSWIERRADDHAGSSDRRTARARGTGEGD